MALCYYCDEPMTDNAPAHLVSSDPIEVAHPVCVPFIERYIDVAQVKPGKVRSGTLYVEDMNGDIYKCNAYIAGDDMASMVERIRWRTSVLREEWTLVREAELSTS